MSKRGNGRSYAKSKAKLRVAVTRKEKEEARQKALADSEAQQKAAWDLHEKMSQQLIVERNLWANVGEQIEEEGKQKEEKARKAADPKKRKKEELEKITKEGKAKAGAKGLAEEERIHKEKAEKLTKKIQKVLSIQKLVEDVEKEKNLIEPQVIKNIGTSQEKAWRNLAEECQILYRDCESLYKKVISGLIRIRTSVGKFNEEFMLKIVENEEGKIKEELVSAVCGIYKGHFIDAVIINGEEVVSVCGLLALGNFDALVSAGGEIVYITDQYCG